MNRNLSLRKSKSILFYFKILFGLLIGCFLLTPIYMMIVSSFKPNNDVFDLRLIPRIISLEGYKLTFKQDFLKYFLNSFFISTTVTVVALIFHSMAGYSLARLNFIGKKFVFLWIISTLMIPFSVIMIPLFILVKDLHWLNSFKGVIIPAIPHSYGIFLFRQFYLTIPKDLEEAATIDGCTQFQIYTKIFLPLSVPITITLAVAFFIANWNNYLWPLIVN